MIRPISFLLALVCLAMPGMVIAEPKFPDRGTDPVVDAANIIDPAAKAELSAKLEEFEKKNQRQFVVATIPNLDGYDISDYGYQLGRHWALGDKERNDGIILLVAPNERKVRIEVGYGLESVIPDGLAYDIINQDILPQFKVGNMTGGIVAGTDAIIRQIELPPDQQQQVITETQQASQGSDIPVGTIIWIVFMVFFFILPMFRRQRGRRYGAGSAMRDVIVWNAINSAMHSGSRHRGGGWGGGGFGGGGFGGGGGFSGGGGSFGGGGASGGW